MSLQPVFPEVPQAEIWEVSIAERPDNAAGEEAAGLKSYYWAIGRTLRVRYLLGTSAQHATVKKYAAEWMDHANLHFIFDSPDDDAEIRVAFDPKDGNWSQIGTICRNVPKDKPTMNLGALASPQSEARYKSVVLHEFGHALGLIHEHQSPNSAITWNEEVVKADLYRLNWDDEKIAYNVFARFTIDQTQYRDWLPEGTSFDTKSVMIYTIPARWTSNRVTYAENSELSELDKAFVAKIYPRQLAPR